MESEEKRHRRIVNAWCLYDWANSAFATTIMAAVLPTFYVEIAKGTLGSETRATSHWGFTNSIALLLTAVLAPVLGAVADHTGSKKRFLSVFAAIGVFFTCLLVVVSTGDWFLASALFIVGNIGFAGANIFYDGLLPHVARKDEIDRVSTRGYALGYLGGGILLAVNLLWILKPAWFGMADAEVATKASFVSVGVWWALFSIPLLRRVPEPPASPGRFAGVSAIRAGFARLALTFRSIRRYRQLFLFLAAFWLYNDGIGTIIKMATTYGSEIGIGQTDLIGALLMTQFVGIPFSFVFGHLPREGSRNRGFLLGLILYNVVTTPILGALGQAGLLERVFTSLLGDSIGGVAAVQGLGSLLLNQIPGLLLAWLLGGRFLDSVARRLNAKRAILLALAVYTVITVWGFYMALAVEFWMLAWMVGLVQGGSQALSRSLYGAMVPKARSAEFFGFFSVSAKFAGIVGPFLFGLVGELTGTSRLSIISLIVFFVVGGALLLVVDEQEGMRRAQEEAQTEA